MTAQIARRLLALVLLLLLVVTAKPLPAHGVGTPQQLNVPSGPYLLSIWTDPDPLRADETHVVVAVLEPETKEPIVTGVEVVVRFTSLDDPSVVVTEVAATDDTNQLLYAAEFNDQVSAGRWQVGVTPTGQPGTGDEVTFEVNVEPARGFSWLWVGALGLGALLVVWVFSAMRAGRARRAPAAR